MASVRTVASRLSGLSPFPCTGGNVDMVLDKSSSADLLDICDGFLFVWVHHKQIISVADLRHEYEKRGSGQDSWQQALALTNPPVGDVEQLLVSPGGQRIALVGPTDITVVQLPRRWGKNGSFEGDKTRITCSSRRVAERFFLTSRVHVSKVRWHPHSPTDSHLIVLCTDNYLRVYDVTTDVQTPTEAIVLGATHSARLTSLSDTFVKSLGDVAVSFDFGPPPPGATPRLDPAVSTVGLAESPVQPLPVFILRGNGDVCMVHLSLSPKSGETHRLWGPIAMNPAADDNYGTDACDLLCLPSSPPLLVVATPVRLYHCVLLTHQPDTDDGVGSELSWSQYSAGFNQEPAAISLYVYECVELELVLTPGDDQQEMTSPVRLHRDPASDCRYFCSHEAGVHAVVLPLVRALEEYSRLPDSSEEPLAEQECVVEHLVCTRTMSSSPACPVVGLTVLPHPLHLIVLLAAGEVLVLPLAARFVTDSTGDAFVAADDIGEIEETTSQNKVGSEPFEAHVARLLERTSSQPVLHSATNTSSAAQRLQLLTRAAHLLRVQYVQRQQLARGSVQLRAGALRQRHAEQVAELAQLSRERRQLTERAQSTAERYEDLRDKHRRLMARVEAVFQKCQQGVPVLSDAEKSMRKELQEIEGAVEPIKARLDEVQAKFEYQKREMSTYHVNAMRQNRELSSLGSNQLATIREFLAKEGDQIANMKQKIATAKKTLET